MFKSLTLVVFFAILLGFNSKDRNQKPIIPGEIWNDISGNPINAHGGGIVYHAGKYFGLGSIKKAKPGVLKI